MPVTSVAVTPNDCGLEAPFALQIGFTTDEVITNAYWELTYVVDVAAQRKSVKLGASGTTNYGVGGHVFEYNVPTLDFSGVKKSLLRNVGLMLACLKRSEGEEECLLRVSMVTQVAKQANGQLVRTVLSPLD